MIERKTFTFNGEDSADYGLYIAGDSVYNAPERVVDMISIPGRDGQLAIDMGRYENILVTYPCFIFADTQAEFRNKIGAIRNWLCSNYSYKRLADGYNPESFRLGLYKSGLEVDPVYYNRAGEFELTFDCKPQRFLTAGEVQQNIPSGSYTVLMNPTPFPSLPLIEVEGTGTLEIADKTITISGSSTQTLLIDSEMMEVYTISGDAILPANNLVSFNDFPKLNPGENGIGFTGLTSVKITPRWWTL